MHLACKAQIALLKVVPTKSQGFIKYEISVNHQLKGICAAGLKF